MILKQYYLGCRAHASYLVGDDVTRLAAVIDPAPDVEQVLEDARLYGLKIIAVFLTRNRADHESGHRQLAKETGAEVYRGAAGGPESGIIPVQDGDGMDFGQIRLRVLETPGKCPSAVSLLLYDLDRGSDQPHAVLTGDTLLLGDVGWPEAMAGHRDGVEEMASRLYDSLDRLRSLPDETLVFPAHVVGAVCPEHLPTDTSSTIGAQRRQNYALQPMIRSQFVDMMTAELPEEPRLHAIDALSRRWAEADLEKAFGRALRPLLLDRVLGLIRGGAQVVDTRTPAEFAGGHLRGSINIGLRGEFHDWTSTMLDTSRPIVLMAPPGRELETVLRMGTAMQSVVGYVAGGVNALAEHPELLGWVERVTPGALQSELLSNQPPLVVDVRSEGEWSGRHVEGSINIPLDQLQHRLDEIPSGWRIVVACTNGYRSSLAISLIKKVRYTDVADLIGGMGAWEAAGLPLVGEQAEAWRVAA